MALRKNKLRDDSETEEAMMGSSSGCDWKRHRAGRLKRQSFRLVRIQQLPGWNLTIGTPTIVTDAFRGFPQSLQANAVIVPPTYL
jgi:hypothetical protein